MSGSTVRLDTILPVSPYWTSSILDVAARPESVILPNQSVRLRLLVKAPEADTPRAKLNLSQPTVVEQLGLLVQNKPLPDTAPKHEAVVSDVPDVIQDAYEQSRSAYRKRYLASAFPAMTTTQIQQIFPAFDPLDLDIATRYTILPRATRADIPDTEIDTSPREGTAFIHGLRPAPAFSLVQDLREQVARELQSGNKSVRTMYEETGRIRRIMVDSILDGVLSNEEDPVVISWSSDTVNEESGEGGSVKSVQVRIRNTSPALAVRWVLRLHSSQARYVSPSPPCSLRILTCGRAADVCSGPQTSLPCHGSASSGIAGTCLPIPRRPSPV